MFDSNCKKTFHSQALNRLTVLGTADMADSCRIYCARNHLHTL